MPRVFDDFKHMGKFFQTVGVRQNDGVFWPEPVLLYLLNLGPRVYLNLYLYKDLFI